MINGKKIVKISLWSIIAILLALATIITTLISTVDQNTIKNRATQLVYEKTGRDLKIDGDINWTIFPWLGFKAQNVSLSNPQNFAPGYLAKAQKLSISVKLWPLVLAKNIEANHITFTNITLQLLTEAGGKNNWQDLFNFAQPSGQSNINHKSSPSNTNFSVKNITIKNGNIFWNDQKNNNKIRVNNLNLDCKNFSFTQPFTLKSAFKLSGLSKFLDGDIAIKTNLNLNRTQIYLLDNLKLNTTNADINGSLKIDNTLGAYDISGNLIVKDTGSQALTKTLNLNSKLNSSFSVNVELSPKTIKLSAIQANISDATLRGSANYSAHTLNFDFALNKFDSNILSPTTSPKTLRIRQNTATNKSQATNQPKSSSGFINTIKTNGSVKIGKLNLKNIILNNFSAKIIGANGIFNISNMGADCYQKRISGNSNIDTRNSLPQLNVKLSATNLPIRSILADLAKYEKFSGALNFNIDISMHGTSSQELVNSLSGNGNILINNGIYYGIDIPYEVRKAHAIINAKSMPPKTSPAKTEFNRLTMSFGLKNALLNTNDLLIQAPDYKVTGKGSANLINNNLNLALSAYSNNDTNFFLPAKITGSFTNPSVKFDTAIMLQQTVKKAVTQVISKQIEKLSPNIQKILPLGKLFH